MPKYTEEILAAVTELQQHPTAEQVFLEMKREHPSIAIGTVYKHLNALAEEGLLHRITESGSPCLLYTSFWLERLFIQCIAADPIRWRAFCA